MCTGVLRFNGFDREVIVVIERVVLMEKGC